MKKVILLTTLSMLTMMLPSCTSGNEDDWGGTTGNEAAAGGTSGSGTTASVGDLTSFDVAIDSTDLSETETVPSDNEDYIENNTFSSTVNTVYNGSSAPYARSADRVTLRPSAPPVPAHT